jgi:bidirectional [NiFe] hydrogenase diaphorase subunit
MIPTVVANVRVVTFKIDDRDFSAREDETIIQVAWENGIRIPSLCYLE